jgi:putative colanic acid biosynthesis acetyltransferase WcaF
MTAAALEETRKNGSRIRPNDTIEIGPRATIAQEAYLSTGTHDFARPEIPLVTAKIIIGEDAFIGARAFVMPGVAIGPRSVIGACSVVTKDVASDVIAAGNPCKVLGMRSEPKAASMRA